MQPFAPCKSSDRGTHGMPPRAQARANLSHEPGRQGKCPLLLRLKFWAKLFSKFRNVRCALLLGVMAKGIAEPCATGVRSMAVQALRCQWNIHAPSPPAPHPPTQPEPDATPGTPCPQQRPPWRGAPKCTPKSTPKSTPKCTPKVRPNVRPNS